MWFLPDTPSLYFPELVTFWLLFQRHEELSAFSHIGRLSLLWAVTQASTFPSAGQALLLWDSSEKDKAFTSSQAVSAQRLPEPSHTSPFLSSLFDFFISRFVPKCLWNISSLIFFSLPTNSKWIQSFHKSRHSQYFFPLDHTLEKQVQEFNK